MILNINSTTIKINKAFIIENIESNKDVITNFNWTLCEINLNGLKVLNNLNICRNSTELELSFE